MSKTLDEIVDMGLFSRPFLAWASYASEEEISAYFDMVFGRVGDVHRDAISYHRDDVLPADMGRSCDGSGTGLEVRDG